MMVKPKVLFVDDDADVRTTWKYVFEHPYDVTVVSSGAEALDLLKAPGRPFDVLVTDHRMPGMTGVELCRKARLVSPKTARVLVTAFEDPEVKLCPCRKLEKPLDDGKLEAVIHDILTGEPLSSKEAQERESVAEAAHAEARASFREATKKLLEWAPATYEEAET